MITIIDFSKAQKPPALQNTESAPVWQFLAEWQSARPTITVQTSGSTGTPKILEVEKNKMLSSAEMTCNFLRLQKGDSALLCLPVDYISGKMMVVRSVFKKLKLIVVAPSLTPLENLNSEIDFCAMTPLQVENSLDKIYLIKKLIIGGAQVSDGLKRKIREKIDSKKAMCQIFETYGMTETLSHIALREIYPNDEKWFKTLDSVEISTNENGCLEICAPKLNAEKLLTNDLVEIKSGKEFRFLGRVDNIINSGGAKIFPEELEILTKKYIPGELIFSAKKDEVLGEELVLVLEGSFNENILSKIKEIPFEKSFHKPKEIIFITEIPRTENGKINRPALKNLLNEKF